MGRHNCHAETAGELGAFKAGGRESTELGGGSQLHCLLPCYLLCAVYRLHAYHNYVEIKDIVLPPYTYGEPAFAAGSKCLVRQGCDAATPAGNFRPIHTTRTELGGARDLCVVSCASPGSLDRLNTVPADSAVCYKITK